MIMMMHYIIILILITLCSAEHQAKEKPKRSYVCPPNFMRLSNKCYFFSNKTANWQNAYWRCRDMHSNIATIKNANQDRILRRTLDHDALVPLERWVGGRYDWGTMSWKWGASGRKVQYQGFAPSVYTQNKDSLNWHCIVLDPVLHYKWNARRCTDEKHYICQTKIRVVNNKDKKKLQKQYNSKLNEVPVPEIQSNDIGNATSSLYKYNFHENNEVSSMAYAWRPKVRSKKNKKDTMMYKNINGTLVEVRRKGKGNKLKKNKLKGKKYDAADMENIRWKTYYESNKNPLHPRVAVEEFSYS